MLSLYHLFSTSDPMPVVIRRAFTSTLPERHHDLTYIRVTGDAGAVYSAAQNLIDRSWFSTLQLRRDVHLCLLVPGFHCPRLTGTLQQRLLSPSTLFVFKYVYNSTNDGKCQVVSFVIHAIPRLFKNISTSSITCFAVSTCLLAISLDAR